MQPKSVGIGSVFVTGFWPPPPKQKPPAETRPLQKSKKKKYEKIK
jgi:hypothetical protein